MLFKNSLFTHGGNLTRLLHVEADTDKAWVIVVDDEYAWPVEVRWSAISGLEPVGRESKELPESRLTPAAKKVRNRAMDALAPLLDDLLPLFNDVARYKAIKKHAAAINVSIPSLYKWLRKYWQNGQTPMALLPGFHNCGRSEQRITGGRGAQPKSGYATFQLTHDDISHFEDALEKHYWSDGRATLADAFTKMLEEHYSFLDGNGDSFLLAHGERPTYRQLQYYVKTNYSEEQRLRARKGNKDFELQDRGVLGTVLDDCLGVGHYYEADATIADLFLVAADDRQCIVGKPTVYLIVDRESRLIVGLYVGLENPSWVCAKQAVLFISEDKEELCRRHKVVYNAKHWPAHMVFPQSFLVDLGEWNSRGGEQLAKNLATKVAFVPAKRADWKPVVESKHKQTRTTLQYGTPGFDPPENAKRRQGKHYENDACLTLAEFWKLMLELVIKHNSMPLKDYPLSTAELREGFIPSPINLWNRGIVKRAGLLTRYPVEHVRMQLLSEGTASVTEHGIEYRGCLYTTKTAIEKGWFVRARKERFPVQVSFDLRLVDNIYVHDPNGRGEPMLCELSTRSDIHRGRSFAEVKCYQDLAAISELAVDQLRLQAAADYNAATAPTVKSASTKLATAQKLNKKSKSARRKDVAPARKNELKKEQQETASLKPTSTAVSAGLPSADVIDLGALRVTQDAAASATVNATGQQPESASQPPRTGLSIAERARLAREKLKEGTV